MQVAVAINWNCETWQLLHQLDHRQYVDTRFKALKAFNGVVG